MDIQDLYNLIEANLDNHIRSSSDPMKRIKLPIPEEFGGGMATGNTLEAAVRNLISRLGVKAVKEVPTFSECAKIWLNIKEGQKKSPSTIADYKRIIETRMIPFFGDKPINAITPDNIQLYYNSIMDLSKSYSTQSKAILKGVFERAERNGWIESNPMRFAYERSHKVGKKVVLQDDKLLGVISQLDLLKNSKDHRDYLYACFLCFTALRRGEILGLRWSDIDFEKDEISVRNNVTFPDGINTPYVSSPKDDSFGIVHLNSQLKERLLPYRKETCEYIIPFSEKYQDKPVTRSMFMKMWSRIKKAIDLKGATSHSFRASYASMMNAHCDHIDPKALQGALRHKTPDLAIKVYTKQNDDKTRLAELEYDKYLRDKTMT